MRVTLVVAWVSMSGITLCQEFGWGFAEPGHVDMPWVALERGPQMIEVGGTPPLLSTGDTKSGVLGVVVGFLVHEKCRFTRVSPVKSNKDD